MIDFAVCKDCEFAETHDCEDCELLNNFQNENENSDQK